MISRSAAAFLVTATVSGSGAMPAAAFDLAEPCRIMTRNEIEATLIEFGMERSAPGVFRTQTGVRVLDEPDEECLWVEVDGMWSLFADGPDGGYYLISRIVPDKREDAVTKAERLDMPKSTNSLSDASVTADGNVIWVTFQPDYTNPNWGNALARLEERMFLLAQ